MTYNTSRMVAPNQMDQILTNHEKTKINIGDRICPTWNGCYRTRTMSGMDRLSGNGGDNKSSSLPPSSPSPSPPSPSSSSSSSPSSKSDSGNGTNAQHDVVDNLPFQSKAASGGKSCGGLYGVNTCSGVERLGALQSVPVLNKPGKVTRTKPPGLVECHRYGSLYKKENGGHPRSTPDVVQDLNLRTNRYVNDTLRKTEIDYLENNFNKPISGLCYRSIVDYGQNRFIYDTNKHRDEILGNIQHSLKSRSSLNRAPINIHSANPCPRC